MTIGAGVVRFFYFGIYEFFHRPCERVILALHRQADWSLADQMTRHGAAAHTGWTLITNPIMDDNRKNFVRDATIINELGLHARSAAKIAKIAQRATGKIWILKDTLKVDAASVIDILTLEGFKGSKITIKIEDHSDAEILNELEQLVTSGFGE